VQENVPKTQDVTLRKYPDNFLQEIREKVEEMDFLKKKRSDAKMSEWLLNHPVIDSPAYSNESPKVESDSVIDSPPSPSNESPRGVEEFNKEESNSSDESASSSDSSESDGFFFSRG
jgi:hypothetical protein